ncbi:hypothetical protein HD554DRAFT_2037259 [Boletus coccyginus]|nr:hypothetical protein HD554DRAFT_2037259 [Boletus coccyginus]
MLRSTSTTLTGLSGLLGPAIPSVDGLIGLGCTPITVIGTGSGASCTQQPVCCSFNGVVDLGYVFILSSLAWIELMKILVQRKDQARAIAKGNQPINGDNIDVATPRDDDQDANPTTLLAEGTSGVTIDEINFVLLEGDRLITGHEDVADNEKGEEEAKRAITVLLEAQKRVETASSPRLVTLILQESNEVTMIRYTFSVVFLVHQRIFKVLLRAAQFRWSMLSKIIHGVWVVYGAHRESPGKVNLTTTRSIVSLLQLRKLLSYTLQTRDIIRRA